MGVLEKAADSVHRCRADSSGRCEGASTAEVNHDLLVLVVDIFTLYGLSRWGQDSRLETACSTGAKDPSDVIGQFQALSLPSGTGYLGSVTRPRPGDASPQKTEQLTGSRAQEEEESSERPALPPSLAHSHHQLRNNNMSGMNLDKAVGQSIVSLLASSRFSLPPSPHLAPHPTEL